MAYKIDRETALHGNCKLTEKDVRRIRWARESALRSMPMRDIVPPKHPASISNLAKQYGVATSTISLILQGRTYNNV